MDKITTTGAIWDLHIHTCNCPKGSNEFSKMSIKEFVEKFTGIIGKYDDLKLISFTDHNQISIDVYREYINQGSPVEFIVGVEVDTYFKDTGESKYKHLIVYFEIDKSNFKEHVTFMEAFNSKLDKKAIKVFDLLNFLIEQKIRFTLSPHAFKQGDKAIDFDWNDEETTDKNIDKYTDQFFCFWEASGFSSIAKAEEFLKDFESEDKISVISFSDSNCFKKLEEYLDNPTQFFSSLPSYKGLQMVATEFSRLSKEKSVVDENSYGNLIGKVNFCGQEILFTNKLNAIIGGRGSGKSLLLDSIANNMKTVEIEKARKKYINEKPIKVYNFDNHEIKKNNFSFDYFSQSYVSKLFKNVNYYKEIKEIFSDAFKGVEEIDYSGIKIENKSRFEELIKVSESENLANISNLVKKYKVIDDITFKKSFKKKDIDKSKYSEYVDPIQLRDKTIRMLPKELRKNAEVIEKLNDFIKFVLDKNYSHNSEYVDSFFIKENILDNYKLYTDNRNAESKNKAEVRDLFISSFEEAGKKVAQRVNIINAYLSLEKDFQSKYEETIFIDGEDKEAFLIKNVLDIQSPLEFFMSKIKEYFSVNAYKSDKNYEKVTKAIDYYCYSFEKMLLDKKKIEDLDKDLLDFELKYDYHPEILYKENKEYSDITSLSPGTQTNVLMEYLVYKETTCPLLIDQPEDNVDNYTIYNKLRGWFKNLKNKRQVLVVTHDANIVINSDAENIIIAIQEKKDDFKYSNGALEYNDNLDKSSKILDGGKEAVKRRMMKYGE